MELVLIVLLRGYFQRSTWKNFMEAVVQRN